jgi:putative FmdB family regulatory protein
MPIYDYTCTDCGHLTEVIHGINDDGPRYCPACGAEGTMKKGFATPAVHFKGSGWARKERSSNASSSSRGSKESGDGGSGDGGSSGSGGSGASDGSAKATRPASESPSAGASKDAD